MSMRHLVPTCGATTRCPAVSAGKATLPTLAHAWGNGTNGPTASHASGGHRLLAGKSKRMRSVTLTHSELLSISRSNSHSPCSPDRASMTGKNARTAGRRRISMRAGVGQLGKARGTATTPVIRAPTATGQCAHRASCGRTGKWRDMATLPRCACGKVWAPTRQQAERLRMFISDYKGDSLKVQYYMCEHHGWHWTRQQIWRDYSGLVQRR